MVDAQDAPRRTHSSSIKFRQWLFARQWNALKAYANEQHIRLIGDIPIFVAHDSADVWANRDLFYLDEQGNPTIIAGVPPDYFSETGQRWGNPLYKWHGDGARRLSLVDFALQGDAGSRSTSCASTTSGASRRSGQSPPASQPPSRATGCRDPACLSSTSIKAALGGLPIIAEDLGVITPPVEAMRDTLNLPGMIILQFAWGDLSGEARFLPHNHRPHSIVYTGTHDNNTTNGWWFTDEIDDVIRNHMSQLPRPPHRRAELGADPPGDDVGRAYGDHPDAGHRRSGRRSPHEYARQSGGQLDVARRPRACSRDPPKGGSPR